jgi:hypothetical protein
MKTIWNVLAILAFANVVAMVGVVGWLLNTGRLDAGRVEAVRALLAETTADEAARLSRERQETAASIEQTRMEEELSRPPVTASEQVAARIEASEVDRQRIERMRREVMDLQRTLQRERSALSEDSAAFEAARDAFLEMRERVLATEQDEQFRKSVEVLNGMKAKDSATTLLELIVGGDRDRAVDYIDAMDERARVKVMTEVTKLDPALAAGLLEDLRVRGIEAAAR